MNVKIRVVFLFLLANISCSTSTPENAAQQEQNADTLKPSPAPEGEEMQSEHHEGEEEAAPLSLNNGLKWKADNGTNENVKAIKKVVDEFEGKANPSLNDYHNGANKISEATNKLLAECKMTGPEHEALHQWLLPLIDNTKKLLNSKETAEAEKIFTEIKERLNLYDNYFE